MQDTVAIRERPTPRLAGRGAETGPGTGAVPAVISGWELRHAVVADVGGKAWGLHQLRGAGVRVPEWVTVSTAAFRSHLERHQLLAQAEETLSALDADLAPADVEAATHDLRTAVEGADIDPRLERQLADALLFAGPYAVRSSVVGEDSADRSFAGLFDSMLFLADVPAVCAALRRCWASAFNSRALLYQLRCEGRASVPAMGAVVQQLVAGEVSGVMFTVNPVSGEQREMVLTACWGLGEGVVGGISDADELVCSQAGAVLTRRTASKDVQVVPVASGGTACEPVPAQLRDRPCLSDEEAAELCAAGRAIADALGGAQDIEWTRQGGRLHFLQSRPVTATASASTRSDAGRRRVVWDNSNIQESFCGVTTPLTFSFALRAYASVYEQTLRLLGVRERVIAGHRSALDNMLGLVHGRIYYNINNWYRLLRLLPSFGRNKADMEHMMGLDSPVDFVEDLVVTWPQKFRRLPSLLAIGLRLEREFLRLPRSVDRFQARVDATLGSFDRARLAEADLDELLEADERLRRELIERWQVPIINDIWVMRTSGRLRRLVERALPDEAGDIVNDLLAGQAGMESTEPTHELLGLAQLVREDEPLRRLITEGPAEVALAAARARGGDFAACLERFIDRYGDRCMGELKLETVSLRQDATFVVHVLRNYIARPDIDAQTIAAADAARRRAAEQALRERLGRRRRRQLQRRLRSARHAIKARENMRFARTRGFALQREIYLAIGHRLHDAGRLHAPRDVFYLTVQEIEAFGHGTAVSVNPSAVTAARMEEFVGHELVDCPNRIETAGALHTNLPATDAAEPDPAQRLLRGTGCSTGTAEGEVRLVMKPEDDLSVAGRILVAVRTDPGWTPLFPSAAGLLIERGSALSHSAVLAREFGIPAVVGVPNVTRIVRDGERVRLDGGSGTVERLEQP